MSTSKNILNRVRNMVYNTSEKYNTKIEMKGRNSYTDTENVTIATMESLLDLGLTEKEATAAVMYAAAHEGAHVKLSGKDALRGVLEKAQSEGADLKLLNGLCQVAEDYRVDYTTTKQRPGYWVQREEGFKSASKLFEDKPSPDKVFNLSKAISFFTYGTDLREYGWEDASIDWDTAREVADDLIEIAKTSKNSTTLLEKVYEYYKKKFGKPKDDSDDGESDSKKPSDKGSDGDTGEKGEKENKDSESDSGGDGFNIELDEDNPEDTGCSDSDEESDSDSDSASDSDSGSDSDKEKLEEAIRELEKAFKGEDSPIDDMVGTDTKETMDKLKGSRDSKKRSLDGYIKNAENNKYYLERRFKPIWTEEERKRIQEELCVGVHSGADIMYADIRETSSKFNTERLTTLVGHARMMGSKLTQALRADVNDRGYISKSGANIMANKVWKPLYTGDAEVFYKKDYSETGGYVIDLVLDASGSQGGRERTIRDQAFIIAEACSIANIPCRVSQFETDGTFTLIERIRDFDAPRLENLNCAKYYAGYDNRDGLALQIANVELQKRSEPNKIMLVLSDGAPQDTSGYSKIKAFGGIGEYSYSSASRQKVVKDVYDTVRNIRKSGTALMGIYVGGGGETLTVEKDIYGNDFAYIRSMESFVDTTMRYLVRHIQGLDR